MNDPFLTLILTFIGVLIGSWLVRFWDKWKAKKKSKKAVE
jgi:hypothetical protein